MKIKVIQNQWLKTPLDTLNAVTEMISLSKMTQNDFLVLPEHVLTSPSNGPLDAEFVKHTLETFSALAKQHNTYLVTGSWLEKRHNKVVNVNRMLDRQGQCIAEIEINYSSGPPIVGSDFPVVDTDKGKVGMLLGQDFWALETTRIQSLKGAELVLVSGSIHQNNSQSKKDAIWGISTLNCVAIAFANTANSDMGNNAGFSTITRPDQVIVSSDEALDILDAEWDDDAMSNLREADLTFRNTLWFGLWARRKDLYQPLVES